MALSSFTGGSCLQSAKFKGIQGYQGISAAIPGGNIAFEQVFWKFSAPSIILPHEQLNDFESVRT